MDEVQVWGISLAQSPEQVAELADNLSADEMRRAGRFHFDRDRRRFIVARAALRDVLARHLKLRAHQISFCYGRHGKPALAITAGGSTVAFNLAHSGELALCALAGRREVGVDVELLRPVPDAHRVALDVFSPGERRALDSIPPDDRLQAFFRCWTRKEAYLKALGDGLARPLQSFQVSVDDGTDVLLDVEDDPLETSRWRLVHLTPAPGYIGALAVEGSDWNLVQRTWSRTPEDSYGTDSRT
jgi:4'-phosphopantetheinyl transferase